MKKLVTIFMMLLFGFSSSGATLQLHYCCGELKSISLGSVQDCGMGAEMETGTCCETKSLSADQQDQEHQLYQINVGSAAPAEAPLVAGNFDQKAGMQLAPDVTSQHFSPPLRKHLFLMNCVFRI